MLHASCFMLKFDWYCFDEGTYNLKPRSSHFNFASQLWKDVGQKAWNNFTYFSCQQYQIYTIPTTPQNALLLPTCEFWSQDIGKLELEVHTDSTDN